MSKSMKWLLAAAVAVGLAVWLIWPVENEPKQGHNKGTIWLTDQERAAMKNAMRELGAEMTGLATVL